MPNPSVNQFFPTNSPLAAKVARGSFQQRDHEIWKKDFNNFAPRAGFAWDVFGSQKLIVRGGGAISYDRIWNNLFENIRFNAPFFSFATVGAFGGGAGRPAGPLVTPGLYANPFTAANTRNFNNPAFTPVPSPRHMDENLKTPYIQQFNLGVQYEFMPNFVFEANYITTAGRRELRDLALRPLVVLVMASLSAILAGGATARWVATPSLARVMSTLTSDCTRSSR